MMAAIKPAPPPAAECASREAIAADQARRLVDLLRHVDGRNPFYTRKWSDAGVKASDLDLLGDLGKLPLTTKSELIADQDASPPWGTARTEPLERYTRYNQTSSTTGRPLRWLDTNESWQWTLECWKAVYRAARVDASDRIFFAFAFGPVLWFLDGIRGRHADRGSVHPLWGDVERDQARSHRRGATNRHLLHTNLCSAPPGSRSGNERSLARRQLGACPHRGR